MESDKPQSSLKPMGCVFTLDISYDFPANTQDVLTLGQVWEVGRDLRLQCEDAYMASETIGSGEKITLAKRFTTLGRSRNAGSDMIG